MSQVPFKPLLAATCDDITQLNYPVIASPKLDGIRVVVRGGRVLTRSLKEIPNRHVQLALSSGYSPDMNWSNVHIRNYEGLDGEIMACSPGDPLAYRKTSSAIMSEGGTPDFKFHVFDICADAYRNETFLNRIGTLRQTFSPSEHAELLEHTFIPNAEALSEYEGRMLSLGYEGVMIRSPEGRYKHGRSTLKEGILLKLKQFQQEEAYVLGFEERMHNANEATRDALGRIERSSHKENMIGRGDLGALLVRCPKSLMEFSIGSGFSDAERREIWDNREKYLGQVVTYKFMAHGGFDKAPRFPTFKGFRPKEDMS